MSLKNTLETEKVTAMKALGNAKSSKSLYASAQIAEATTRLSAIRAALTAVAKVETSFKERRDLTDDEVVAVLRKEVAQRVEAARMYGDAGEAERQSNELAEAAVLEPFLPDQLDEAATRALVSSIITDQGLTGPQAIGRVMGVLKTRSDVDKGLASKLARELL